MDFVLDSSGTGGVLHIRKDMTIAHAAELKSALIAAIGKVEHLEVCIDDQVEVDISSLQLICSVHRTMLKMNKRLSLTGKRLAMFRNTVREAGFSRHVGCSRDRGNSCPWIEKEGM